MAYEPDIKYFQPEEIEAIIGATNSIRDKALIAFIYQCGLRRSEVQLLTRDDYNRARGIVKVTRLKKRNGYWHEVVLWKNTKHLLDQYLNTRTDHYDALFLGRKNNQALGSNGVYYIFRKSRYIRKARGWTGAKTSFAT